GRMPYAPAAAARVGLAPGLTTPKNAPADTGTRLGLLGDVIPVPPLHKVVSPGDVLIAIGVCAVVALAMRSHRRLTATTRGEVKCDELRDRPAAPGAGHAHAGVPGAAAVHDRRPCHRR